MLRAFGRPVATCWVLLGQVWRWSNSSQRRPTCRNTAGSQTRSTCCAQQCCDMLRWHVAIVFSGLYTEDWLSVSSILNKHQIGHPNLPVLLLLISCFLFIIVCLGNMDSVASQLVAVGNNAFQQEETKVSAIFSMFAEQYVCTRTKWPIKRTLIFGFCSMKRVGVFFSTWIEC